MFVEAGARLTLEQRVANRTFPGIMNAKAARTGKRRAWHNSKGRAHQIRRGWKSDEGATR